MSPFIIPPFSKNVELIQTQRDLARDSPIAVPNEPFISPAFHDVQKYLLKELECKVLDELAPYLYIFAKRRASHVDTLHEYDSTQRTVTVSENPGLHLVRNYHVVYCKPIPHCLLNYDFWTRYLTSPTSSFPISDSLHKETQSPASSTSPQDLTTECKASLGLLRSYTFLITHESDFNVARRVGLIPSTVSYTQFQHFIEPFKRIPDSAVSPRYHYGHIRLTRLNLAVRLLRPRALGKTFPWSYDTMHWHAGQFVGRFAAPLLFFFASLTLVLSSMQVGLAAKPVEDSAHWELLAVVSLWFSVAILFGIVAVAGAVVVGIGGYAFNRMLVGQIVQRKWVGKNRAGGVDA
jgi:hypothetical protein